MSGRVLYLVGTAAPPVRQLPELAGVARSAGWAVCPVLSEASAERLDPAELESAAGRPPRIFPRKPGEPDPFPAADAVLVAPLSFNTLNLWAIGVNNTAVLGVLNELLCAEVPIVAATCAKPALRRHSAYAAHHAQLAAAGVRFLPQDDIAHRDPDGTTTFDLNALVAALPT
ncbi:flavoprotein [Saccharopolyspora sp. NFXS83]|uniref:flavoprotein n=1 Tax=Saccharopolyspora sp. NFXS83 TaxID=2993560 RepID=UPI00224B08AA|nr:flavoprotein [Saccharopolyspora sp. NFXS83]MCX2729859.1 flavoprotein [Saccharopolyspora sp. NFXS83]